MPSMSVPVIICVVCLFGGAAASARWLPDLAPGPVGGIALCAVCGLLGMALAVVGLRIYNIVEIGDNGGFARLDVSSELASMFSEAGLLVGLALATYLLAPARNAPASSSVPASIDPRA